MQYILSTSNTNTYHTYVSSRTPPFRTLGQTPTSPQGGSSVFFGETPRYKDFAKATFADLMHHLSGTMWSGWWLNGLAKYWGETKDF